MRKSAIIILMLLAGLVTVVTGCGGAVHYDSRLSVADSLMQSDPDSALAIVEGLPLSELSTAGDSAYHDLLLTQARYRCYVIATSDSAINRALAYYRAHSGEQEKLTRAYIYKGAVMEELGHPDSAMIYYKHAETTAAPDDNFNLGYINMRIAQLYQKFYANDSAVVTRMKKATEFFTISKDTSYLITTIGTQGSYPSIIGEDSSLIYLQRAILMAKKANDAKGFQYQSKLAGLYYYDGSFNQAKELAMDIVRNGKDRCNEKQFYYYAARAYLHLNLIDSARWLMSQIPAPKTVVDSMNRFQLLAEWSQATRQYDDYARYSEAAKRIDTQLLENSRNSKLTETELIWTAGENERKLKTDANGNLVLVICLSMLSLLILSGIAYCVIKKQLNKYRRRLASTQRDLEKMLGDIDKRRIFLEAESERLKHQLDEKDYQLAEMNKKSLELEREQSNINKQVSAIMRYRQAALNELYQNIRISSVTDDGRRRVLPVMGILKEMFEKKGILNKPPQPSFWNNLKLSVDGELQGIASFVEKQYPNLTVRDMHLFLLVCANFPNQIIKLCMNYTHNTTVSKNKKRLMIEKFGMNIRMEEFIDSYLHGNFRERVD